MPGQEQSNVISKDAALRSASARLAAPLTGNAPGIGGEGVTEPVFGPIVVNSVVKPHKKRPNAKSDLRLSAVWSPGEDLNPRPTDYKSVALPLRHQGPAGCRQPALTVATNPNIGQ